MRRFLLLIITAMMTISMMAIGNGSGKDKANAIDFNWVEGNLHETTETLWYNVDLSPVDDAKYLVLYITNLADEAANVKVGASAMGMTLNGLDTVIAVGGYFRFELPMEMVNSLLGDLGLSAFLGSAIDLDHVALSLQSDQKVYLAAKVYETTKEYLQEEVKNNSEVIDWNSGVVLEPLMTKWYEIDIASLKKNKQHLYISFKSYAKETAVILTSLLVNDSIMTLPIPVKAGFEFGQTIDYQLLAKLPVNNIRVGVTSTAKVEIATSVRSAIAADPTPCLNAINPKHGVEYTHKAGSSQWYKVSLDLLKSKAAYSSIYLENKSGKTAHVTIGAVTDCQYTTGSTITLPIPAGLNIGAMAPNLLGNIIEQLVRFEKAYNRVDAADIYLQIKSDQDVSFGLDVVNATTSPCLREDLVTFDWNKGAKVEAGSPLWYDVDLNTVKNTGKHIKFTFTNHTDSLVWAATMVSVDCPAKLTMPLLLPVPAGMSIDKFVDYHFFAVPNVDNIYVGVITDGALELAATTYDAVIAPPADCLDAVEIKDGMQYTQKAGAQWYNFPIGLFNDGGKAGKVSFRNLGNETATLTAGLTVGCEYAVPAYGKMKLPKQLAFSLTIPTSILSKLRKFIDPNVTNFYMQLTSNQDIMLSLDMDASDVKECVSAIPFDWNNWEKNGLQLLANQDIWYEVNLRYPWEKMKKGEDLVLAVTNNNNVPVEFEAAVSPTCPAIFTLESYATIPSSMTAQQVIPFTKVMEFLKQFDRQLYDHETELILEKYNAFVILNRIDNKLGKYGKYFPVTKLQNILDEYGHLIAYAELKDLIDNREKYLSKAEIKSRLEQAKAMLKEETKEHLSIEQAIQVIEQLDDYIPYVEAETILQNYDSVLPYAGGAYVLLKQCKTYLPTEEIKQYIKKAIDAIPMDKIRALFDKIEARLPRDLNCYMRIKTTGDIVVEPDTILPMPEGCADAIEYIWGTDLKINEEAWYKVPMGDVNKNDCDITITVTNNTLDAVKADLSLYENCEDETALATMKNVGIEPNTTRSKTISSADLPKDIDTLYLHVQPIGEVIINLAPECPIFATHYKDIPVFACDGADVVSAITNQVHTVSAADPKSLTWNDTVHVSKYLDSVYTYVVTLKEEPAQITPAILATITDAIPTLTPGVMPDMTASAAAIQAYYQAQDNNNDAVADVVTVAWTTSAPACGTTTHTMELVIEDECGNIQKLNYDFEVVAPALNIRNEQLTICASAFPYTWNGIVCDKPDVYTHKIPNIYGCDSAQVILTLDVFPAIPETVVPVTQCYGEGYTWNLTQKTYNETTKDTVVLTAQNDCDSVVILDLVILPEMTHAYDTATICYGDSITWPITGATLKRPRDYSKTIKSKLYDCDSIQHHLHLIVLDAPVVKPTIYATIDLGQTYVWYVEDKVLTFDQKGTYYHKVPNILDCDSIIYTLELSVNDIETEEHKTITDFVCDGTAYVDTITGKKHIISSKIPATQSWKDTVVVSPILDSIYTFVITPIVAPEVMTDAVLATIPGAMPVLTPGLVPDVTGTINAIKAYYQGQDTEVTADVDNVYWTDASLNTPVACGAHTMTLIVEAGCDNMITTTHTFDVQESAATNLDSTVCYGSPVTWEGISFTATVDTLLSITKSDLHGCDSVINLKVNVLPSVAATNLDSTVCYGSPVTWEGISFTATVDTLLSITKSDLNGCDSLVTLYLTVLPEVVYEPKETDYFCPGSTYDWRGDTFNAPGTYYHTILNSLGCDSIIYTLELLQYVNSLPTITEADILAVCGNAVDVTKANAIFLDHVNNEPLYAPNAVINWYIFSGDKYTALTTDAIDGTQAEITLKFTITTDCGTIESDSITVQVQTPTPENDEEMTNVPAYNKYGGRLLTVDVKYIKENYDWDVAENDVMWYLVTDQEEDQVVGSGYYLTTENGLSLPGGTYYARITHERVSPSDCNGVLQTTNLVVDGIGDNLMLVPSVVKPQELIRLLNLDPNAVSTVRMYTTAGELMDTFQITDTKETSFQAAQTAGYYIVEVQTETEKVSLRYVVK